MSAEEMKRSIRTVYADGAYTGAGQVARLVEFDRMIAAIEREAAARALEDMADELMLSHDGGRRDAGAHSKSAASSAAQKWAMQRVRARAAEYRKVVQS